MILPRKLFFIPVLLAVICAVWLAGCGTSSTHPTTTPPAEVKVAITPQNASTAINQTVQFTATVTGTSNTAVSWSIKEGPCFSTLPCAGTVKAGLYQAPYLNGTYHVVATSVADSSKSATAAVAVSAPFLFIQQYSAGDATPFSVTPIVGAFGADAKFTTANLIDSGTGKPISAAIEDIFIAPDGTKGVATLVQVMTNPDSTSYPVGNVVVGDVKTGAVTQLTNNTSSGQYSWRAQFTADGKKIIYLYEDSATCGPEIWMMNADGSNPAPVYPNPRCSNDAYVYHPTVSPDGTKIAAEIERTINGNDYDGIGLMNIDGTNLVQLTGASGEVCPVSGHFYWDENPSFTADGKQVVFDRHCDPDDGSGCQLSVYAINLDGTGLKPLVTSTTAIKNADPLVVGDKIVFSSDVDTPNTGQFDMYSVKLDGSGLTRLTTNSLFDAFTTDWMWYGGSSMAAKSAAQNRFCRLQQRMHPHRAR